MANNMAMSDTALKQAGMAYLAEKFGLVNAERFIFLFKKEPFDYTEWHRDWLADKTLEEVNEMAVKYCAENPDE